MDGWLTDPKGYWSARFHRDLSHKWIHYQRVLVDHGRTMPDGEPPLLKSRRHLRHEDAQKLWHQLISFGWQQLEPQWGEGAEP